MFVSQSCTNQGDGKSPHLMSYLLYSLSTEKNFPLPEVNAVKCEDFSAGLNIVSPWNNPERWRQVLHTGAVRYCWRNHAMWENEQFYCVGWAFTSQLDSPLLLFQSDVEPLVMPDCTRIYFTLLIGDFPSQYFDMNQGTMYLERASLCSYCGCGIMLFGHYL